MNQTFEYALIPFISMIVFEFFYILIIIIRYIIIGINKKNNFDLSLEDISKLFEEKINLDIQEQNNDSNEDEKDEIKKDNIVSQEEQKNFQIEYTNLKYKKYKYNKEENILYINEKNKKSKSIINVLTCLKTFNEVEFWNTRKDESGNRIIFNMNIILNILKYLIIFCGILAIIAIAFMIIAIINYPGNEVILNLIKVFSLISLTLFIFIWVVWLFYIDKYKKNLLLYVEYLSEEEFQKIIFLLNFNYYTPGIK